MNLETLYDWIPISRDSIWVLEIFSIVFATMLINFIEMRFYRRFASKLEKTKTLWDDALAWAVHKPLEFLIWLIGLSYAVKVASLHAARPELFASLPTIKNIGVVILVTWALLRFAQRAENILCEADENAGENGVKIDKTTAHAIGHLFRISIVITAVLVILRLLNIDITAVLAFGGAGSIIIGFASKDLLANFFGALIIYFDKPFKVGDWIRSPDKNIEGVVEYIGWRMTHIRTFDKRPLYVPNSIFSTISVENPSRMSNRRIKETFGVRYKDASKIKLIVDDIKEMLLNHPEIDTRMALFVNLYEFGPSSLDCLIYTFTKTTAWIPFQAIKQDVMLKIIDIVEKHGAEMAFPTRTIEMPEGIDLHQAEQKA